MNRQTILVELLLAGFFAVACIRAFIPQATDKKLGFSSLLKLPGRLERLRRSRWQWFSMVALLLIVRLQRGMPLVLEVTVVMQFIAFLALPTAAEATDRGARRR